jgi:hypothetical protein
MQNKDFELSQNPSGYAGAGRRNRLAGCLFNGSPKACTPQALGKVIPPLHWVKHNGRNFLNGKQPIVQIVCPYCDREHIHNFSPGMPRTVLTRVSHCSGRKIGRKNPMMSGGGTYKLVIKEVIP